MKTLELNNLPTPVLLVWGLPEDAEVEETDFNVRENKYVRYWLSGKDYLEDFPEGATGNWQLIGKLSELTEEQAKGLVENIEIPMFPDEVCFRDYNVTGFRGLDTALESFRSAVESEGHYLTNPREMPNSRNYSPRELENDNSEYWKKYEKWQDAQSKTLPANTLIFKKS